MQRVKHKIRLNTCVAIILRWSDYGDKRIQAGLMNAGRGDAAVKNVVYQTTFKQGGTATDHTLM